MPKIARKSVLVIEDDPQLREHFSLAVREAPDLRLAGQAHDLPEALRLLRTVRPDVLLVDIGLPSGSGITVIEEARQRHPQCESIVVTLFGDAQCVLACIAAGATGYLLKDATGLDIAQHIRVVLAGGSALSPRIARQLLRGLRPSSPAHEAPLSLSAQESRVLELTAKGYRYDEIAELLAVSRHTVETYVKRVYRKLQVHSKTEAVYEARALGLLGN